jgi:hypothetical protein
MLGRRKPSCAAKPCCAGASVGSAPGSANEPGAVPGLRSQCKVGGLPAGVGTHGLKASGFTAIELISVVTPRLGLVLSLV